MKTKNLFAMIVAGGLALAIAAPSSVLAQEKGTKPTDNKQPEKDHKDHKHDTKDHKHEKKDENKTSDTKGPKVGEKAPTFTLTDTDGKTVDLAALTKEKKIVVLEWFNPECPYVVKHYKGETKAMNDTAKAFKDKNVVWVRIATGTTANKETLAKAKTDWNMEGAIALDSDGTVGKAYASKNTPTMFIINADGVLAYKGAIDDDKSTGNSPKTNYVKNALEQIVKGETVTTAETTPYGCSVKYPKKG
jgi:peroxiredoxin